MLSLVISIGLLGCYLYTHLVFYIYLVPSIMKNIFSFLGFLFLYMISTQPPGYVAQGGQKYVVSRRPYMDSNRAQGCGLRSSALPFLVLAFTTYHSDYFVFIRCTKSSIIVLVMYFDDILLTSSDSAGLVDKKYLKSHFVTNDMRRPKYFLGIEVAHQKHSILYSQRK